MFIPDDGGGGTTPATPTTTAEASAAAAARIAALPPEPAEGAETPPATPAATVPAGGAPEGEQQPETFDRAYVEKLRREAAEHRTEAQRFKEAFDGYSPEEVSFLLDLTKGLASPDQRVDAAQRLAKVAEAVLAEGGTPAQAQQAVEAAAEGAKPEDVLTKAEYERLRAEEARDREAAEAVEKVEAEARSLGYDEKNPDSALFWNFAVNSKEHPGDLQKAHEAVEAYKATIIKGYVEQHQERRGRFPALPTTGATPAPPAGEVPKTFKTAREAVEARVAASR